MSDIEAWYKLLQELNKKPVPVRIEAGTRMYHFLERNLSHTESNLFRSLFGLPLVMKEGMGTGLAHVIDQHGHVMKWFILSEDETKMLTLKENPEPFRYDFQRTLPSTIDRPAISHFMGSYASLLAYRGYDEIGPATLPLEPEGPCPKDGGEPCEGEASGE